MAATPDDASGGVVPPDMVLQGETRYTGHEAPEFPKKIPSFDQLTYRNPRTDLNLLHHKKKNELRKLKIEILKKKQDHYEELTKKQKGILARLEKAGITKEVKAKLLKAFKAADGAMEKLKKELIAEAQPNLISPVTNVKNAREAARKAVLDKEMDIYHGNFEGEELLEAQKDVATLRRQAGLSYPYSADQGHSTWIQPTSMSGGYDRGSLNIDNRPKEIMVSGYDSAHKDDVIAHFSKFGQLNGIEEHGNSMKITFRTRRCAEIAAEKGADFQSTKLILSWFTAVQAIPETKSLVTTTNAPEELGKVYQSELMENIEDEDFELSKEEEEMLLADDVQDIDDDAQSEDLMN